jgi:arginase family enzyme
VQVGIRTMNAHQRSQAERFGVEVIGLVQGAGGYVAGADIVEYNPRQDLGGVTATVAAKLVKEVAGRMMGDAVAAVEIESPRSTI